MEGSHTASTALPAARDQLVVRASLIDRVVNSSARVISVVAPPGYGKTTLLSQLAERLGPRAAWVSCERTDNDPATLWSDILDALERVELVSVRARGVLARSGGGVDAVPRLVDALSELHPPVTLVLDQLDAVTSDASTTSVAELALRVPTGWRLAVASRGTVPLLPLARMRVDRQVVEIGAADLAMTEVEAAALLSHAGVGVSPSEVAELVERTEGWPAGLYLAALALRSGSAPPGVAISGDDRFVESYLHAELLTRLSPGEVRFLRRTSILDRLSGPLCDAVVGGRRSARLLEKLETRNLLVVPLDRRGEWYRYHHLLRELLQADLRREEPELVPDLHSRAAGWYAANDMAEAAIEHADAAGDVETMASMVLEQMQPVWAAGRVETVRGWMELLDRRPRVRESAAIAAHGALIFGLLGHPRECERWAAVAESAPAEGTLPDGSTIAATLAYLRSILCRDGLEAMRTDADIALGGLGPTSPYRAAMVNAKAMSFVLADGAGSRAADLEHADQLLAEAYDMSIAFRASPLAAMILAEQSILASMHEEWSASEALLKSAVETVDAGHLDGYWTSALVFAAAARNAAVRGEMREARQFMRRSTPLRPLLTYALPVASVQALLELAHAYVAVVDPAGARAVLDQADGILRRRPDLGTLADAVRTLRTRVAQITHATPFGASSLTTAELRLLPLLPTHLSFREIADRLHVSPHTVKTQVKSVYRKLGVSSRSQAVEIIADLGL